MWLFSLRNASKSSGHFGIRSHFNDYNLLSTWRIDTHTIHHLFSHSICLPAGIRQFDSNHQMCNFKWAKFMCELFGTTDALWKLLSGIIWNVLVIFASRFFLFLCRTHTSFFVFHSSVCYFKMLWMCVCVCFFLLPNPNNVPFSFCNQNILFSQHKQCECWFFLARKWFQLTPDANWPQNL